MTALRWGGGGRWAARLFWGSAVLAAFGGGMYVAWAQVFPWGPISRGIKTGVSAAAAWKLDIPLLGYKWAYVDLSPDSVEAKRVLPLTEEGLKDPVVMLGGLWAFSEHCPDADGCLAVEYTDDRAQTGRTWPFRADVLGAAFVADPLYREKTPGVTSVDVAQPWYAAPFANGDLLVTFVYHKWHYPSYAGVGRFGRDGRPLWFRSDYSHHEGQVAGGDTVWIPGATLEEPPLKWPGLEKPLFCDQPRIVLDRVHVLDENGVLVDSVSVLDAFLASRWAPALIHAPDPCDPFHLNSVSLVGEDVSGLPGVHTGDLVLSFRELDAFAILGRDDRMLKRYVKGTFVRQHSVKHLRGSEFLVFDNKGGYELNKGDPYAYSRILLVDAASGEETVVFPKRLNRSSRLLSRYQGQITISPDRSRVIASFNRDGKAVEVCIANGEALAEFHLLHDMRPFARFAADSATIRSRTHVFYAYQPPLAQARLTEMSPPGQQGSGRATPATAQAVCPR